MKNNFFRSPNICKKWSTWRRFPKSLRASFWSVENLHQQRYSEAGSIFRYFPLIFNHWEFCYSMAPSKWRLVLFTQKSTKKYCLMKTSQEDHLELLNLFHIKEKIMQRRPLICNVMRMASILKISIKNISCAPWRIF